MERKRVIAENIAKRKNQKPEERYKRHKQPKKETSDEEEVNIDEIEIDESKFIQPDDSKDPVNIVFIGHVDCGKSTTCGSILVETDSVDKNELRKFENDAKEMKRESWWKAYIVDINPEER